MSDRLIKVRASATDLFLQCGQSIAVPVTTEGQMIPLDPRRSSDEANIGQAVHDYMDAVVQDLPTPEMRVMLEPYDLVERTGESLGLATAGLQTWQQVKHEYPDPQAEKAMIREGNNVALVGRADVVSIDGNTVRVLDWKTGRITGGHRNQIRAYGALALTYAPLCDSVDLRIAWLRERRIERLVASRAEVDAWFSRLDKHAVDNGEDYVPGRWCDYCRRRINCHGRSVWLQEAVKDLASTAGGMPTTRMDERTLAEYLQVWCDRKKAITATLDEQTERLKDYIREVGPLPLPNGRVLELYDPGRREIDPVQAWDLMLDAVEGDEDLLVSTMKVGIEKLKQAVFSKAKRGQKGATWDLLQEHLTDIQAMERKPAERLRNRALRENEDVPRFADDAADHVARASLGAAGDTDRPSDPGDDALLADDDSWTEPVPGGSDVDRPEESEPEEMHE